MIATRSSLREGTRTGRLVRSVVAILLIAGIVHLATVLILSRQGGTGAYAKLAALGRGVRLQTFAGPAGPDRTFPYRDPAMADAFCLFDLRDGPVEVSLPVTPLDVATLAIYDRRGQALYALTNRSAVRGMLALTVMTPAMIAATDATDDAVRVPLDGDKGFVMVEALVAMPSLRSTAEGAVRQLSCRAGSRE